MRTCWMKANTSQSRPLRAQTDKAAPVCYSLHARLSSWRHTRAIVRIAQNWQLDASGRSRSARRLRPRVRTGVSSPTCSAVASNAGRRGRQACSSRGARASGHTGSAMRARRDALARACSPRRGWAQHNHRGRHALAYAQRATGSLGLTASRTNSSCRHPRALPREDRTRAG